LKPENLLISSSGMVKIADFGLARYYGTPDREVLTNNVITRQYRYALFPFQKQHPRATHRMLRGTTCLF
jgi:cyclin-dependent kinase 7